MKNFVPDWEVGIFTGLRLTLKKTIREGIKVQIFLGIGFEWEANLL